MGREGSRLRRQPIWRGTLLPSWSLPCVRQAQT